MKTHVFSVAVSFYFGCYPCVMEKEDACLLVPSAPCTDALGAFPRALTAAAPSCALSSCRRSSFAVGIKNEADTLNTLLRFVFLPVWDFCLFLWLLLDTWK